jgi:hypothetical protein
VFMPATGIGRGASPDWERGRERCGWQAEGLPAPGITSPTSRRLRPSLALSMSECQEPRGMPRGVSKTARRIGASTVGDNRHQEDAMPATDQQPASRKHRPGTNVRQRQAQVSVRLSPDELTTLKKVAEQEGLTLPSALRAGFLRHAEHCG